MSTILKPSEANGNLTLNAIREQLNLVLDGYFYNQCLEQVYIDVCPFLKDISVIYSQGLFGIIVDEMRQAGWEVDFEDKGFPDVSLIIRIPKK